MTDTTKPKPVLLHLGTLQPGVTENVVLKVPIPDGLSPLVVNVRVGDGGKVVVVKWDRASVEVSNRGLGPASYMIFAGTEGMHHAVAAAAKALSLASSLRGLLAARKDPAP